MPARSTWNDRDRSLNVIVDPPLVEDWLCHAKATSLLAGPKRSALHRCAAPDDTVTIVFGGKAHSPVGVDHAPTKDWWLADLVGQRLQFGLERSAERLDLRF